MMSPVAMSPAMQPAVTPIPQRATPMRDSTTGGTFQRKAIQMSNQPIENQPIFRKFNFDAEKKKKVYPRAGSGNMWARP